MVLEGFWQGIRGEEGVTMAHFHITARLPRLAFGSLPSGTGLRPVR